MGNFKEMKLSVVMTCYDKANLLEWTLLTLIKQEISPDEIIIIDDGSSDETENVIHKFQRAYPNTNIKYYYNNNPEFCTCAWGFNCGIKKATGEIIMLTKPEILHPVSDVKIILEHFRNPGNARTYIIGKSLYQIHGWDLMTKIAKENFSNPIAITQRPEVQAWYQGLVSEDGMITYFERGGLDDVMGVLKEHLLAVGGFDERFSKPGHRGWEDVDLFQRLGSESYGLKEVLSPDIIPIHLYHTKPPACIDEIEDMYNYKMLNETALGLSSNLGSNRYEANMGKEWGVLKK